MNNEATEPATDAIGSNALFGTPLKEVTDAEQLRNIAEKLWQLLDDIDTASDIFKPTEERPKSAMNFFRYAMRKCEERGKELESDGYTLFLPNAEAETSARSDDSSPASCSLITCDEADKNVCWWEGTQVRARHEWYVDGTNVAVCRQCGMKGLLEANS